MNAPLRVLLIFAVALAYALVTRLLFAYEPFLQNFAIVSWTFIGVFPMVVGAITTFLGFKLFKPSRFWEFGAPALVMALGMLLSIITALEAILCVVVAMPVMIPFAILGGWLMGWFLRKSSRNLPISIAVILPFVLGPLEQQWEQPHESVTIQDCIEISATPEQVWAQIVSVPAIRADELPAQAIYWLDFPRPISAEIDFHGVGAKRTAIFEREVSFFEIVTEWEPLRALGFSIEADPAFIPHTAFDQHIIVGERFYDVLSGRYEIEPTADGCRLVLTSTHRLSTPFNFYAGFWSRWVMNQIQGSILVVIKARAEGRS